jgi:hypothetical protein
MKGISAGFYFHEIIVLAKKTKNKNPHENNHLYSKLHCEWKLKLKSLNTRYCLTEVVTKEGLTVFPIKCIELYGTGYS